MESATAYIRAAVEKEWTTPAIAGQALGCLEMVRSGMLPVPDVAIGETGEITFIWDDGDHYMEASISPDDTFLFYENRSTGKNWSAEIPA